MGHTAILFANQKPTPTKNPVNPSFTMSLTGFLFESGLEFRLNARNTADLFAVFFAEFINAASGVNHTLFACVKRMAR